MCVTLALTWNLEKLKQLHSTSYRFVSEHNYFLKYFGVIWWGLSVVVVVMAVVGLSRCAGAVGMDLIWVTVLSAG